MSEKRRGLGRGLGALIPSAAPATRPVGDRPVDVFFPEKGDGDPAVAPTARAGTATLVEEAPPSVVPVVPAPAGVPDSMGAPAMARGLDVSEIASSPAAPAAPVVPAAPVTPSGAADTVVWDAPGPMDELIPVPGARFAELPVGAIRPNARQPRQVFDEEALAELVFSIKEVGVLQPIVVRQLSSAGEDSAYELIMGERRWRAAQEAGLERIPAIIRDTQDDAMLRDALLENLHRSQLNPLEEAAAYQQLLDDFGCTHEELAGRIGRSRPQISNTLRLLKLPPLVQRRVAAGVLSAGHARALLGLEDSGSMEALAARIVSEGLSVRAVEEIVALGDGPVVKQAKKRPRPGAHHSELDDLASRLGDRLDTRVSVALGRSRGRLSIDFASVEDLNRIISLMAPDLRKVFAEQ